MNTIGKILVVLNFLFAVIVGVLLVYDFAARNKWREAYESLVRERQVAEISRGASNKATEKVLTDYTQGQLSNEKLKQDKADLEVEKKVAEDKYNLDVAELKLKLQDKDLTLAAAASAKQRLTDEIVGLNKTIKDREGTIVKNEANIKTFQVSALNFESLAKARQIQNENLLEQLQEKTRLLAQKEAGVNPDAAIIRNPNEPNPPAVYVKGTVEKVDNDLVQISLGTDQGVNKNNTLDIYRTSPAPMYLGMIRIVDANHHKSVARFVAIGTQSRPQLKEGDTVASKLSR